MIGIARPGDRAIVTVIGIWGICLMPEFVNPFTGVVPGRRLTDSELLRALRLDLSAEEEAAHLYLAHADATDNELAKRVLKDIANEERVHKGEFQRLINILSGDEESFLAQGAEEVDAIAEGREPDVSQASSPRLEGGTPSTRLPVPPLKRTIRTIGDLKGAERG
jgi:hypothetical protein